MKVLTAYKWSNAARQVRGDRVLLLYLSEGRPVASCKVYPTGSNLVHTFVSMAEVEIEAKLSERTLWAPKPNPIQFQRVQNAPAPANTASLRRIQMKRIAREFTAVTGDDEAERQKATNQLRLLPTPLYRYPSSPPANSNVIDGAVFCFVVGGGNPQVLFLLEAIEGKDKTRHWRCGFSRRTFSELKVSHKSKEIWGTPHFDFRQDMRASFHRVVLPPVPDA